MSGQYESRTLTIEGGIPSVMECGKFSEFDIRLTRITGYGGTCQVHINPLINGRVISNVIWDVWSSHNKMHIVCPFTVNGLTMYAEGGTVLAKIDVVVNDNLLMDEPPPSAKPPKKLVPKFGADIKYVERLRASEAEFNAILSEKERLLELARKAKRAKTTIKKKKAELYVSQGTTVLSGRRRVREVPDEEDEE